VIGLDLREIPKPVRYWWVNQNQTFRHKLGGGRRHDEKVGWKLRFNFTTRFHNVRPKDLKCVQLS
jgi:hypothetical protein